MPKASPFNTEQLEILDAALDEYKNCTTSQERQAVRTTAFNEFIQLQGGGPDVKIKGLPNNLAVMKVCAPIIYFLPLIIVQ